MSLFRSRRRRPAHVPTPDITATEVWLLEQQARNAEAAALVNQALVRQARLLPDDRDAELVDLCLELRSTLAPAAPGSQTVVGRARMPANPGWTR